jgi:hypothetical protein
VAFSIMNVSSKIMLLIQEAVRKTGTRAAAINSCRDN